MNLYIAREWPCLNLKNKFSGQRTPGEFLSIYRAPELKQRYALKDNVKDWTCSADSTLILQWTWEAKCCRAIAGDSFSKIGTRTCGFISLYFIKVFQLGRIMYHNFSFSEFVWFFWENIWSFMGQGKEKKYIWKEKDF